MSEKVCVKCGRTLKGGEEVWSAPGEPSGRWCNACHIEGVREASSSAPGWMVGLSPECLKAFEKRFPTASKGLSESGKDVHSLKMFSTALNMLQTYWSGWQDAKEAEAE